MTEEDARTWIRQTFGTDAYNKLERFSELLLSEAASQNLIARSTLATIWSRHIADSAQLVPLTDDAGLWVDVGSGGGLPGLVVAIVRDRPIVLVEPRRKRAEFLAAACNSLGLPHATVTQGTVQKFEGKAGVVSARAVASLSDIFSWTRHITSRETLFLLPRGGDASNDLELAQRAWQGVFHVEQSVTDPTAGIVTASGVRPK